MVLSDAGALDGFLIALTEAMVVDETLSDGARPAPTEPGRPSAGTS